MRETKECPVCGSISDAHKITCTWMPPNREWQCECKAYNNSNNCFCWHCSMPRPKP